MDEIKYPEGYDNTSLDTYRTCPRKWQYVVLEGIGPKVKARSLDFGAAVHRGLQVWYASASKERDEIESNMKFLLAAIERAPAGLDKLDKTELRTELTVLVARLALPPLDDVHAGDRRTDSYLEAMLRTYAKVYAYEPFKVKHVESTFSFILPDGSPYTGILDLVVEWFGKTVIVEHKTASQLNNYGDSYTPHHGTTGYIFGLTTLVENAALEMVINALATPRRQSGVFTEKDFQRFPGITRTPEHFEEFFSNSISTINDIKRDIERGFFEQNTNSCHQYEGCPFRKACSAAPGRERELTIAAHYVKRAPWNAMRRDEEEIVPMLKKPI